MLRVLNASSELSQQQSRERLQELHGVDEEQGRECDALGLSKEPCVSRARLQEFEDRLQSFSDCRASLAAEREAARKSVGTILDGFEQRGMKHVVFQAEVGKLDVELEEQEMKEAQSDQAHAVVREREAVAAEAQSHVDQWKKDLDNKKAAKQQADKAVQDADRKYKNKSKDRDRLNEVMKNAPANCRLLTNQAHEAEQQMTRIKEKIRQLATEVERGERKVADLREREAEAEQAKQSLTNARTELEKQREGVSNELYLTEDEIERLKRLEEQLQPARPSRLRRSLPLEDAAPGGEGLADTVGDLPGPQDLRHPPLPGGLSRATSGGLAHSRGHRTLDPGALTASAGNAGATRGMAPRARSARGRAVRRASSLDSVGGAGADKPSAAEPAEMPEWDEDIQAEKTFRESPQFRSLSALCEKRKKLWEQEQRWLQDIGARLQASHQLKQEQLKEEQRRERKTQEEQENIRQQFDRENDHEGHVQRHQQASEETDLAYQTLQEALEVAARAGGDQKAVEQAYHETFEVAQERQRELKEAKEAADSAAESAFRSRASLDKCCQELEKKAREQLRGWKALEMQECRLRLLQESVSAQTTEEKEGRTALVEETERLKQDLERLRQQLDCTPTANLQYNIV